MDTFLSATLQVCLQDLLSLQRGNNRLLLSVTKTAADGV